MVVSVTSLFTPLYAVLSEEVKVLKFGKKFWSVGVEKLISCRVKE